MLEKVYQDFCSKDDYKPNLKKPFYQKGRTIATNGHVLISTDGKLLDCQEMSSPDACNVIDSCRILETPIELDVDFIRDLIIKNSPLVKIEGERRCPDCDGDGYRECDMGHDHECDECDGEGKINIGIKDEHVPDPDTEFYLKDVLFRTEILLKIFQGMHDLGFKKCNWSSKPIHGANLFTVGDFKIIGMPCYNPNREPIEIVI